MTTSERRSSTLPAPDRDDPAARAPAARAPEARSSEARSSERWPFALAVGVALVAFAWGAAATRIWVAAANDPDSAASVLFFQHLSGGHRLEAFVATTPKPLLTLLYGVTMALTSDWRALEVLALLAFATAAGLAAVFVGRVLAPRGPAGVAGGIAFVTVAVLLWPDALTELYGANSFVWALAFWLAAAVALSAGRPRFWLAGVALFLAGLVRTESWLLAGLAALFVLVAVVAEAGAGRGSGFGSAAKRLPPARRSAPLLLGLLAPLVACAHDLLLTGSPLYWQQVPTGYTQLVFTDLGRSLGSFTRLARETLSPFLPFAILALIGLLWLVRTRRIGLAVSMAWLAGGIVALLWFVAASGTYVTARYFEQPMAVGIVVAAIGAGWIAGAIAAETTRRTAGAGGAGRPGSAPTAGVARIAVAAAACGLLAALLSVQTWGAPSAIDAGRDRTQQANVRFEAVAGTICAATAGVGGKTVHVARVPLSVVDEAAARVFVPRPLVNRAVAQCHADVRAVGDTFLAFARAKPSDVLRPGDLLLHDRSLDGSGGAFASFESAAAVDLGSIRLLPITTDAAAGIWLYRVEAP